MSMVSKVKGAGNSEDIPNLSVGDYLRKETQNEKAAAMLIVKTILQHLHLSMAKVEKELRSRAEKDWDSPGEEINLQFLKAHKHHAHI